MSSSNEIVRPGEPLDLYYYSAETSKKQALPTTQNTKYVQNFSNTSGGSSTFIFPPQCGLQDVVVSMSFAGLPASAELAKLALPSGWGYLAIKSCSFRYAGTSQFTITGDQLLQNALRDQTSRASCDDLLNLGGNYASGTDLQNTQVANIVLRLPHASASGVNKSLPFPTDCITQACQLIVELNPPASIWTNVSAILASPTQLASASFQAQQIMFNNMGDALARRVDLSTRAYAFPCEFVQQKVSINLVNNTNPQPVVLTGFRAGSVKSIQIWLSDNSDLVTSSSGSITGYNANKWYAPSSVEMLYAGEVYARYNNGVGQLFNLINGNKSSAFDMAVVEVGAGGTLNPPSPFLSQWLELPFAQPLVDDDAHYILLHGKMITNGITNLNNLVVPYVSTGPGAGWTLNISYIYNSTILFSQGSCDFIF